MSKGTLKELGRIIKLQKSGKILIPYMREWVLKYGSVDPSEEAILFILDIIKNNKERSKRFHSSASADCKRAQLLSVLGFSQLRDTNVDLDSIFDDGKWRHLKWQAMLYMMDVVYKVEYNISYDDWYLDGSSDVVINLKKKLYLIELKGANDRNFSRVVKENKPMVHHLYQVLIYLIILQMMGEKIDAGIILYENKDNQRLFEFVIRLEDYKDLVTKIRKRYRILNKFRLKKKLTGFECSLLDNDIRFKNCSQHENCIAEMLKKNYPKNKMNDIIITRYDNKKTKFFTFGRNKHK